jgi:O-antigen ligase/tetratricopeptide (TPR) repeat protein
MLAWVGVALGAVYLIYIGGAWWGIYSPQLRILTMSIAALTLGAWVVIARRNSVWRPRSLMRPAIAASLASLAISTAFSKVPRVSLEYLGYAIVLAALYLLLVRLFAERFFQRRLLTLASMLFAVTAAAYVPLVVVGWLDWWSLAGNIGVPPLRPHFSGLTYNNPSAVLTMVALLAMPLVGTFVSTTRRGISVLVLVLLTVGVVALMSGSRAGWFALALTAIIAPIVWLAGRGNRSDLRAALSRLFGNRRAAVLASALVAAAVALAVLFAPAILRRALERGEDLRLGYATTALRMFNEAPLVGTGPGTWVILRPGATTPAEPDYYIPHAHNLAVQTLAELGVLGAIAGVILLARLAWLLRNAARSGDPRRRWMAWATGIGLVYFGLHQALDFYVNMPAFLFAAALPVAYLDATRPASTQADAAPRRSWANLTDRLQRLGTAAAAVISIVAIVGLLLQERPALMQDHAVQAANDVDWAAADAPAREAAALDPQISSYQFTAGLTAAHASDHGAAAAYFERVARQDDLPEAWLNLAAEQAALGRNGDAERSLRAALRVGYQRAIIAMPAGDLALRIGAQDLALEAFVASLIRAPSLAADSWWRENAERMALFEQAVDRSARTVPEVAWEIELMAGDVERALSHADPESSLPTLIIQAWDGDATAADRLFGQCGANQLDANFLAWCARTANHLGREAEASAYRERVAIISLGVSPSAAELRVSPSGMVGRQLPGDPADLWATYTYRRPAPWDVLVPSLIHLKLA